MHLGFLPPDRRPQHLVRGEYRLSGNVLGCKVYLMRILFGVSGITHGETRFHQKMIERVSNKHLDSAPCDHISRLVHRQWQ